MAPVRKPATKIAKPKRYSFQTTDENLINEVRTLARKYGNLSEKEKNKLSIGIAGSRQAEQLSAKEAWAVASRENILRPLSPYIPGDCVNVEIDGGKYKHVVVDKHIVAPKGPGEITVLITRLLALSIDHLELCTKTTGRIVIKTGGGVEENDSIAKCDSSVEILKNLKDIEYNILMARNQINNLDRIQEEML